MPRPLVLATALLLALGLSVILWVGLHLFTAPPIQRHAGTPDTRFPDPFVVRNTRLPQLRDRARLGQPLEASAALHEHLALHGIVAKQWLPCELVLVRRSESQAAPRHRLLRRASPEADGSYRIEALATGTYELRLVPRGKDLRPTSPSVTLRLERSSRYDFGSSGGLGNVQVRILGPNGDPLPNTLFALHGRRTGKGSASSDSALLAWGRSDSKGEIRLDQLPRGELRYTVWWTPTTGKGDTSESEGLIEARASTEMTEIRLGSR
ncbi:MAG: hypothetical protein CSA62_06805 [Planctomycetota bacterium]|nr:MAG: hypothetical protein CSA62_06805 [Planctomycetota bacterium]